MTQNHFEHIHNLEHYPREDKVRTRKLGIFIVLLLALFLVELFGGYYFKSVALMSDAIHVASDSFAIVVAYVTLKMQQKMCKSNTYGYQRLEVLATILNCLVLFAAASYIMYEAVSKILNPTDVEGIKVLIIAVLGLIINLVGLKLIHSHSHGSMVVKSAYLEALADTATSVGVIFSALLIYYFDILWIDGAIALLIAAFIFYRVAQLFRASIAILMQSTPSRIDIDKLERDFLSIKGVTSIHQLHIWDITPGDTSLSVHIVVDDNISDYNLLLQETETMLSQKYAITHTTIQVELAQ